jgi:PAS domain S-box-containing protein
MNIMKKILVIEDDLLILESTVNFLKEKGFDVHSATDGVAGIQLAIEIIPDIIISDISMPKKNGFEVCKTLQQIQSLCNIPFIFLTAKDKKEDIRQGMQLGADDYLTKPFHFSELLKIIKIRLEKHERYLNQNDEQLFALIDNPMVGVYVYDNNKFTYSNSKLIEILGYTKEELCLMSFEDIVSGEENEESLEKIHRCTKGIQNYFYAELKIVKKDQSAAAIEVYGSIITVKGKECLMGNILEVKSGNGIELLAGKDTDKSKFSQREIEVLQLICQGLSTSEISEKLFLSKHTIDTHRANLIAKTESRNTPDLVMYAIRNGFVKL